MLVQRGLALPIACLFWCLLANANETATPTLPIGLTFCADRADSTEPTQVLDCEFRAHNPAPQGMTPAGARWVRLSVQLNQPQPNGLRLYVGPHYLPHLVLYEQIHGSWSGQTAGAAMPMDSAHSVVAGYRFVTTPQRAGESIFYLRVQAPGLMPLRVLAEPLDAPERGMQTQLLGLGLQIGGLLLMTVLALGSTLLRSDRLMQRFAVYALNLLLCVLSGSGLLSLYVLGDYPRLDDWVFHGLWCLRLSIWIWLMSAFFDGWTTPRWYRFLCLGLQITLLACLAFVAMGWLMAAQYLVLLGTAVFSIAQIVVLLDLRDMPVYYRRVLMANFLSTDALIVGAVLASVYASGTDMATLLTRAIDFATPLILLLVMAYKRRLDQEEHVRVKVALQNESQRVRIHQQAVQDRKLLIDMLTHEMRNPLSSISFALGSLEDPSAGPDSDQAQRLRNIRRSISNMDSVIERCSLMNVLDQATSVVKSAPLDLAELVHELVFNTAEYERIDLELPAQVCPLNSDRQLLKIIIGNLLENALRYSPEGSHIQVQIRDETSVAGTKTCVLSVTNAIGACGIPEAEHVFQKFYRHPLARTQSGSGLGLYLVQEICNWLGGHVTYSVSSQVLFAVRLPA